MRKKFIVICLLVISLLVGMIPFIEGNYGYAASLASVSYEDGVLVNGFPLIASGQFSLKSLGTFKCTAYCPCKKCCGKWAGSPVGKTTSTGVGAYDGITVAVDPTVVPYGSVLYVEGLGFRIASDCGGGIKGNHLDVYFANHDSALGFGSQRRTVYLVEYK